MLRDTRILLGAALLMAGGLAAGCSKSTPSTGAAGSAPAASSGSLPAGHPDVSSTNAKPPLKGVVMETMNSGGYTYAKLNVGGNEVWAAGPTTQLAVGDTVSVSTDMQMQNFTSKTLNRTFDKIYFTQGFLKPGQTVAEGTGPGQGVVQQTIDAGEYTYVQVASGDSAVWLAAPTTKVVKGQTVSWTSATPMKDFSSRTLNRTFARILLVGKLNVLAGSSSKGT